jgi:CheY-like chemotaxis protein
MDGLTAVKQLRKEEKELGLRRNLVIALTGNAREQQRQNALDAGMDAVVSLQTLLCLQTLLRRCIVVWYIDRHHRL